MCGIAGVAFADPARRPATQLIERMAAILRHRGPDGHSLHSGPGIGLGVRRLAIIDLQKGDQPIACEDGSILVICNGEIYNHIELRAELEARGHRFRTGSDAEVIVHLYEDEGPESVRRLRGMFAFALWDGRVRRLWLVRDRLGIKPLYYSVNPEGIYFGSELKAILAAGLDGGDLDVRALDELFTFGFVLEPRTLFGEIRHLRAGHWLLYDQGRTTISEFWRLAELFRAPRRPPDGERWVEQLRAKLEETVRLHLRSDVPVGAWLSGGVDSSAIVGLARQVVGHLPTFTLAFADPAYDETRGQRTLDQIPGHEIPNDRIVCDRRAFDRYPEALWHSEVPSASGVEIPRLLLSEAAARRVKVALTGEGADEVFGGYPWFLADRLLRPFGTLPYPIRNLMLLGPVGARACPWIRRILLGPRPMGLDRYGRMIGPPGAEGRHRLFSSDIRKWLSRAAGPDEEWTPRDIASWAPFAQLQYYELATRLPGYIMLTLDRMSMACGLETRVPFMDHELVELCAQIPSRLKLRGVCEKHILRRAMTGVLPAEILWRQKRALRAPIREWLRGPLPAFAEELFSPVGLRRTGYFDPSAVRDLLTRHQAGRGTSEGILVAVLGTQLWDALFRQSGSRLAAETGENPSSGGGTLPIPIRPMGVPGTNGREKPPDA